MTLKQKFILRFIALVILITGTYSLSLYQHEPSNYDGVIQSQRFTKLNKVGEALSPWQGPWSCVVDSKTGLIWENKTDDESIHDGLWSYSWYQDKKGVENAGDCYFEPNRCDTSDLIKRMNQEKTCGISTWRLPTEKELKSLVFEFPKTGEAKIANEFFPNTKRGDYWTSTSDVQLKGVFAHLKQGAVAIDFIEGKPRTIPYRNAAFVRLVSDTTE